MSGVRRAGLRWVGGGGQGYRRPGLNVGKGSNTAGGRWRLEDGAGSPASVAACSYLS